LVIFMSKIDEQTEKEMIVRYGISASRLKELVDFVNTIGEFAQYLGVNQYYGEEVNKKVALLNVDAQAAALECEELIVRVGALRDSVKKNLLEKKKAGKKAEKKAALAAAAAPAKTDADLTKRTAELEAKLFALNERALALTRELRCEFGKKGFTTSV